MRTGINSCPGLVIYLLGRLEVWRRDQLLPPLATQKTKSLFAYLVLHRQRAHSRDELAELFWGDRDERRARHSLATALWRIRRLIGDDYLLAEVSSVQFNPAGPLWLDAAEFEKLLQIAEQEQDEQSSVRLLQQAIDLYRGDLLEELYDDWSVAERYRLENRYLQALKRLVFWHQARGENRLALAAAQAYLGRDPLMEALHFAAMRALVALGERAEARRQWLRCCEAWQQELHISPSPEMIKQAEEILGEQVVLPLAAAPFQAKTPGWKGSLERPPFVGRDREMEALWSRWEQALSGQGGLVLIAGEAGVGKTRLTEEFAALVSGRGGMVGRGGCYEPERALTMQPLVELVRSLARQGEAGISSLPGWTRQQLARLAPELDSALVEDSSLPITSPLAQPEGLFTAIAEAISCCARRTPLLIVLEDLHWATETTVAAVHFLARHWTTWRVLCLGSFRPEEVGENHPLAWMVEQLPRTGLGELLILGRLSAEAVSELLQRILKTGVLAELAARLYQHTDGNPFFMIETLRALPEGLLPRGPLPAPGNVRAVIAARLRLLSPLARRLIGCAAVVGRSFDGDLLYAVLGADEDAFSEAMDELLRLGLIREGSGATGGDYEFVHSLVQAVAYAELHQRRRRLHRVIGAALEARQADQPVAAGTLAYHFEAGGQLEKALFYRELAAQRAMAVFAWQEAEKHQGRILGILNQLDPDCTGLEYVQRRGQILADRAQVHYLQAHLRERDADLEALEELAHTSEQAALYLQLAVQRARYRNLDAQYEQAIAAAEEGLPLAGSLGEVALQGYLLTQIGFAHYFLGQPRPALTALDEALRVVPAADQAAQRHITHILGYVYYHMGEFARSLAYQQAAYAAHQSLRDLTGLAWAGLDMAATCLKLGRLAQAEKLITKHLSLARRLRVRSAEAYGLTQMGYWQLCRGFYTAAAVSFQQALQSQQILRTEHGRVAAETGLGLSYHHLGQRTQARDWLEQAVERARPVQHRRRLAEALTGLGLVEIASARLSNAHCSLYEAVQLARKSEAQGNLAASLAALARVEREMGERQASLAHAIEAAQVARKISAPNCEMWGELETGLSHLALGDLAAALEHADQAVALVPRGDESWIGTEQVYETSMRILQQVGKLEQAEEQRRLAERVIAAKARLIRDAQQRRDYLDCIRSAP